MAKQAEAMSSDLSVEKEARLRQLAERFGIRLILQFGSTVGGPTHARTDLDLAVQFAMPDVPFDTVLDIQAALSELFPGREVDVAILNRADPLFLKKITQLCRLLYGASQDLARLRVYAFKRYQDFRPYLELERRYVSHRLADLAAEARRS
jgi:predicted nucleotidyltransferase